MSKIYAAPCRLEDLLAYKIKIEEFEKNGKKPFVVPPYQRPYSWGENEIESFMETVFSTLDPNKEDEEVFIGTIQLNFADENYEVIDGQQRITTILLLINFLEKMCKASNRVEFELRFENICKSDSEFNEAMKLAVESISTVSLKSKKAKKIDDKSRFEQNLALIKSLFIVYADENKADYSVIAKELLESIKKKLLFVVLLTDKMQLSSIITLFYTINTTGLDLNSDDLFKLQYYQHLKALCSEKDSTKVMNYINKSYDKINDYNNDNNSNHSKSVIPIWKVVTAYKHILVAKNNLKWEMLSKSNEAFFDEILKRKDMDWCISDDFCISNEIKLQGNKGYMGTGFDRVVNLYIKLYDFIEKRLKEECSLVKYLSEYLIDTTRYSRYITLPCVFAFLGSEKLNDEDSGWDAVFECALDDTLKIYKYLLVESVNHDKFIYAAQSFICNDVFSAALNGNALPCAPALSEESVRQEFERRVKETLFYNQKRSDMVCRLLAVLEEINAHSTLGKIKSCLFDWDNCKFDKEHIFSRNLSNDEALLKSLGWSDDDNVYDKLNGIGNLVLLERNINRSISDKPYKEKKISYLKSKYASVKQVAKDGSGEHWAKEDVEKRAEHEYELLSDFVFGKADNE